MPDDEFKDVLEELPLNPQDVERSAFEDEHDYYQPPVLKKSAEKGNKTDKQL